MYFGLCITTLLWYMYSNLCITTLLWYMYSSLCITTFLWYMYSDLCITTLFRNMYTGSPRASLQVGTRLLWGPGDRLSLISKLRIWGPLKPLVNFHMCFISCAAECPNNIYFIQSSDKHNQLMQQGVTCLSCFIVNKIWSIAIKIIYQILLYNPNWDFEKTFW